MAIASGQGWSGFGPTTFSQSKPACAHFEYTDKKVLNIALGFSAISVYSMAIFCDKAQ